MDKEKSGSKCHVVVGRKGVPLAVIHTAANTHDSEVLEEVSWTPLSLRCAGLVADRANAQRDCMLTRATTTLIALPESAQEERDNPAHRWAAGHRDQ